MDKRKKIRVGSKLVEMGKVYRVYKIEKSKTNGEVRKIIHYKPYFSKTNTNMLVCSIPEGSMDDANIRRPINIKDAREILRTLRKKTRKSNSHINRITWLPTTHNMPIRIRTCNNDYWCLSNKTLSISSLSKSPPNFNITDYEKPPPLTITRRRRTPTRL